MDAPWRFLTGERRSSNKEGLLSLVLIFLILNYIYIIRKPKINLSYINYTTIISIIPSIYTNNLHFSIIP